MNTYNYAASCVVPSAVGKPWAAIAIVMKMKTNALHGAELWYATEDCRLAARVACLLARR
jgi:hypothetical protein